MLSVRPLNFISLVSLFKKVLFVSMLAMSSYSCNADTTGISDLGTPSNGSGSNSGSSGDCGTHNGKSLHLGPEGGCYYINSGGTKTYVNRSECKCR